MSNSSQPPPCPPLTSLPVEIHAATRSYHTSLNRLITSRLPLCLPPYVSDASIHLYGISTFAEIYFAFEREWISIISSTNTIDISPRIQNLLRSLHHPSLPRTARLKHDLSLLSRLHTKHERLPSSTSLTSSIPKRIHSRPHILLAYTWIMYLALFNGGRWIRSQLLSSTTSTPHFWPDGLEAEDCLTFWYFDSKDDGEDIKNNFKTRFEAVAVQLTEAERQDVVEEAVEIIKMCGRMVEDLDCAFAAKADKGSATEGISSSELLSFSLVSTLAGQLNGLLIWVWRFVLAPVGKGQRGVPDGHGMMTREAVELELR